MKTINRTWSKAGVVLSSALLLALTGCMTYVEEEPVHTVYSAPEPVGAAPPVEQPAPPPPDASQATVADAPVIVIHSASDFYDPLAPFGQWVDVGGYGRCWRPIRVEADWRPYSNGHWQETDAGWYWVSEEPWAWATYHYGRWDWTLNFGWVWVPQTQWAPAWVAWREGGGYVGWAPLPPTATFVVGGGVVFRDASFEPRAFVFVNERDLLQPVRRGKFMVNNTIVINKTVNITKIRVVNRTVVNEGPRADQIEKVSGHKIEPLAIRDLRRKDESTAKARGPLAEPARAGAKPDVRPAVVPRDNRQVEAPKAPVAAPGPNRPQTGREAVQARVETPARTVPTLDHPASHPAAGPVVKKEKPVAEKPAAPKEPVKVRRTPVVTGQPVEKPLLSPKAKGAAGEGTKKPVKNSGKNRGETNSSEPR